jgi:hypothetical protein
MFIERRATPRLPVIQNVAAELFCGDRRLTGQIADISANGVRVIMDEASVPALASLAAGERISLIAKNDHQAFECEIRRVGAEDLGLFFLDLATNARRRELIAKIAG